MERRAKPRINEPFAARVWGVDSKGEAFELEGVLENISSTGLYLKTQRELKSGSELRTAVQLVGTTLMLNGRVLRNEQHPDGRHGIAVGICEYDFVESG